MFANRTMSTLNIHLFLFLSFKKSYQFTCKKRKKISKVDKNDITLVKEITKPAGSIPFNLSSYVTKQVNK